MLLGWARLLLFPLLYLWATHAAVALQFPDEWPSTSGTTSGERVSFPTSNPFTIGEVGEAPPNQAQATFFAPEGASTAEAAPAVILLHGASGVKATRSLTYARQFAQMGVGALVIDAFSPRRDLATSFTDRLVEITEAMLLADAYGGLRWLHDRPEIDGDRIAMMGFSYGGMATLYAVQEQVAEAYAPDGLRFAAHVAFYAPCIARFEDKRTTGAPVLMLMGSGDQIIDIGRCGKVAEDLRGGGSDVEMVVYQGAYHMWDGGPARAWRPPHHLADCRLVVERDGSVYDENTWLPMSGPLTRKLILALCINGDGYLIQGDETVRAKSNAAVGRFLKRHLGSGNRSS